VHLEDTKTRCDCCSRACGPPQLGSLFTAALSTQGYPDNEHLRRPSWVLDAIPEPGYLTAISVLGGVGDQTSLTYCTKLKTDKENRSKFGLITAEIPPACPPKLMEGAGGGEMVFLGLRMGLRAWELVGVEEGA
jgi:hypothetical protein